VAVWDVARCTRPASSPNRHSSPPTELCLGWGVGAWMQRWPACSVSLHMTPLTLNAACSRRCVDTSRPHVAAARKDKSTPCMRVRSSVARFPAQRCRRLEDLSLRGGDLTVDAGGVDHGDAHQRGWRRAPCRGEHPFRRCPSCDTAGWAETLIRYASSPAAARTTVLLALPPADSTANVALVSL
jgi:hypothetical protein